MAPSDLRTSFKKRLAAKYRKFARDAKVKEAVNSRLQTRNMDILYTGIQS